MRKLFLILTLVYLLGHITLAQNIGSRISRGATEGELYLISLTYYYSGDLCHRAVFHSTDYGEHISMQYEYHDLPGNELWPRYIIGTSTPGTLYCNGDHELWISYDFGENWEYIEYSTGSYAGGHFTQELFKYGTDYEGTLYFSNDYGNTFIEKNNDIKFKLEVGLNEGELYGINGNYPDGFTIKHSTDYGETFETIPIDTSVAYHVPIGRYPCISRGAESGELYLFSWTPEYRYKVFYSADSGHTWSEQFHSPEFYDPDWGFDYTAGKEPGSVYIYRKILAPTYDHWWLFIDHSSDYGQTFETYFHDMDSSVGLKEPETPDAYQLSCSPNPFSNKTTISFKLEKPATVAVKVFNNMGIIKYNFTNSYMLKGKHRLEISADDLASGVYYYSLEISGKKAGVKKMVVVQ